MIMAYARRMQRVQPSAIRELLRLGADPSVISFGGGYPDPALFPVAELGRHAWQRMWDLLNHRPPGHAIFLRPRIERRGSAGPARLSEPVH